MELLRRVQQRARNMKKAPEHLYEERMGDLGLVALRDCGVSSHRNIQKLPGCGLAQQSLGVPAKAGADDRRGLFQAFHV